jgi:hypothetical protein
MLKNTTRRRSLLAVAGVTAGVASVAINPPAANAQETDDLVPPGVDIREVEPATEPGPAPAQLGTCFGASDFLPGGEKLYMPTTQTNSFITNCLLVEGNTTDGVYKLEDALERCYGQNVALDRHFGNDTTAALKRVQDFHGITVDGKYGPETAGAMFFPILNSSNQWTGDCGLLL